MTDWTEFMHRIRSKGDELPTINGIIDAAVAEALAPFHALADKWDANADRQMAREGTTFDHGFASALSAAAAELRAALGPAAVATHNATDSGLTPVADWERGELQAEAERLRTVVENVEAVAETWESTGPKRQSTRDLLADVQVALGLRDRADTLTAHTGDTE